jgi:hypothetical protein
MRTILAFTISGMYVAVAVACSADRHDSDDAGSAKAATCDHWIQRLLDCEVIAGSRLSGCADDDPILPCVWDCMGKATCKQIKASYCNNSFNSYAGCINECHMLPPPPFVCNEGTEIDARRQCDGVRDCPNGDDEDGCTQGYFSCDNDVSIPASWQCDSVKDCAGGEDEHGCPDGPMFTCADGETLPADRQCNAVPDCPDGDDEIDCAILTCD